MNCGRLPTIVSTFIARVVRAPGARPARPRPSSSAVELRSYSVPDGRGRACGDRALLPERAVVNRGDRLDFPGGRGQERLVGCREIVERAGLLLRPGDLEH